MTGGPGDERVSEIFERGTWEGEPPEFPVGYEELERRAREALSADAEAFVASGAGPGDVVRANERAFDRWELLPRVCRDVADRDSSVELFGRRHRAPFLLAPVGIQSMFHEDAELATARGAAAAGVPAVLSCCSSTPLEAVADALGDVPKWFQLYWSADRAVTDSLLGRAEDAGYDAVVVTVDAPLSGWRERELERGYSRFRDGKGVANYWTDPAFREGLSDPPEEDPDAAIEHLLDVFVDPAHDWTDLEALVPRTDLPVVVKGVLHPEDARRAVAAGADGVVVSNHGGRQVDGSVPALRMLPAVADAVGEEARVLFDSGVRSGADLLKALALGADAAMVGRPYVYGLALDGADGVEAVCRNLLAAFDLTLGLSGHTSPAAVDRSAVVPAADGPPDAQRSVDDPADGQWNAGDPAGGQRNAGDSPDG